MPETAATTAAAVATPAPAAFDTDQIRIFGHRGLKTEAPENTLAAFRLGAERGVQWFETDVDLLGDGTPVLLHDTRLDRTTNRRGSLYDLRREDLEKVDAGAWFAPAFRGEPLPTLAQFVDFLIASGTHANIELKANEQGAARSRDLIAAVGQELSRLPQSTQIIVSSFSHVLLAEFKRAFPQYAAGCLYERAALYDDWLSVLQMVGADYIHPEDSGLTPAQVEAFRQAGFGVNVWTVNARARANELLNWGVTGIFTDVADQMLDLAHPRSGPDVRY